MMLTTGAHRSVVAIGLFFLLVPLAFPAWGTLLTLTLEAAPNPLAREDRLTYTVIITNSGADPLTSVVVLDPLPTGLDQTRAEYRVDGKEWLTYPTNSLIPIGTIIGGATVIIEIRAWVQYSTSSPLVNTVTANAQGANEGAVSEEATASVELFLARFSIDKGIQDSYGLPVSLFASFGVGETITYVYTIRNTGDVRLTGLSATDDRLGEVQLARTTLDPWESTSGTATETITEDDLPGPLENTVVVTALDPNERVITGSEMFVLREISYRSVLELVKTADITQAAVGDIITYTYTVLNQGDVTITDLKLVDDQLGEIPLPKTVLISGESFTVAATAAVQEENLPGPLTNVARLSGLDPLSKETMVESAPLNVSLLEISKKDEAVQQSTRQVIINEVAWAGTPANPDNEWIELRNLGTVPVDLNGWSLCWYPKGPIVPDQSLWKCVELTGTISPSPIDLTVPRQGRPEIVFLKRRGDEVSWLVFNMLWWAAGKKDDGREPGFYVLERWDDSTVSNVSADLIYDAQPPYHLEIPDKGAVVLLMNAEGDVVDTANAEYPERGGWPAGDARTGATMERSSPLIGDIVANWHTNPGILVRGLDSAGNRLAATCGRPNSPSLEELVFLANTQALPYQAVDRVDVDLRLGARDAHPWVRVTTPKVDEVGALEAATPHLALSGRHTEAGYQYQLVLETTKLLPGTYYVWITSREGEAILIPITLGY
jgi:uncharacterized repeat protein (TIGR01451 family)